KAPRVRVVDPCDLLRCSDTNDFAAFISGFRSEIDNPIGALNHFKIVLDDDDRVPAIDQSLEKLQQHRHIVEMQTGGWFVENEEIAACSISVSSGLGVGRWALATA